LFIILNNRLFTLFFFLVTISCTPVSPEPHHIKGADKSIANATQYLLFGSGKENTLNSDSLTQAEISLLKDGDILLRRGYGTISDFIAEFLSEEYPVTHCGFIIKSKRFESSVLHTISNDKTNGMIIESLKDYSLQSQDGSLIAVRLKKEYCKPGEVLSIANQLLEQNIEFDMGFDDKSSSTLYCVEMMRNIFLEVYKKDLLSRRTNKQAIDVLSMDNFIDSTYFDIIINHFDSTAVKQKRIH
jgi:hypothetical protein